MKIGNINIEYPLFLAPMSGVTDQPFRIICKKNGASVVYTEFVSADGIIRENVKTLDMVKFENIERPIGVQIFGNDPDTVSESAFNIYNKFKPDIIDINFGCPVPKVTKKGGGSAALRNLDLMEKIAFKTVKAIPKIPVTVKMRAGWDKNNIIINDAGIMLESIGIKAITLHARTSKQMYRGQADWNLIGELKNTVKEIPIIGNGDISSIDDYKKIKQISNCDGVMIGRGCLGNPWIFKEILYYLKSKEYNSIKLSEIIDTCFYHIDLLKKYKNNKVVINLSKKHLSYYLKNFNNSSIYRKEIMKSESIEEIELVLKSINQNGL